MIPLRIDERTMPSWPMRTTQTLNRYGNPIQLLPDGDNGVSLNINGDAGIGDNPNRTRQHAFHFTADNCIGCHACEAACSEKNSLPPHLSFRSVGYVEGGTYPDYARINISMACNHCDDPVCLKGCPTRAYTKHPEYGAVIQDPDICFGCGYCTWVCPYNAPQLDPLAGQVEKCNMCVDRLEVGLKPACVSACVGNALDLRRRGERAEATRASRHAHSGLPDPNITKANIRFQQRQPTPHELTRPDSAPVKYRRDEENGYRPVVDMKADANGDRNKRVTDSGTGRVCRPARTAVGVHLGGAGGSRRFRDDVPTGQGSGLIALATLALVGFGMAASHGAPRQDAALLSRLQQSAALELEPRSTRHGGLRGSDGALLRRGSSRLAWRDVRLRHRGDRRGPRDALLHGALLSHPGATLLEPLAHGRVLHRAALSLAAWLAWRSVPASPPS